MFSGRFTSNTAQKKIRQKPENPNPIDYTLRFDNDNDHHDGMKAKRQLPLLFPQFTMLVLVFNFNNKCWEDRSTFDQLQ
jgi:hypothetical protein